MKKNLIGFGIITFSLITIIYLGIVHDAQPLVAAYTGDIFKIPSKCHNLGLIGCTPHPTAYLKKEGLDRNLRSLRVEDFIDMNDLTDSFSQVLHLCVQQKVDHLLIVYLPIYFVEMRTQYKEEFTSQAQLFLQTIGKQISRFITDLQGKMSITIPVTLILPTKESLEKTPIKIISNEDRLRYSIKQLPKLLGINISNLESITIINNHGSEQNEAFISYLKYEYLFHKELTYSVVETNKKRFHRYL